IIAFSHNVSMPFQWIPAGCFRMGSRGYYPDEEPQHWVRITQPFYLGTTPVTQEQFAACDPQHKNEFDNKPDHPAEKVNWNQAVRFCQWMNETLRGLPPGYVAGLPTEAQWEYACRTGSGTEYCNGDGEAALREVGWFDENSKGSTQPVRSKKPND